MQDRNSLKILVNFPGKKFAAYGIGGDHFSFL